MPVYKATSTATATFTILDILYVDAIDENLYTALLSIDTGFKTLRVSFLMSKCYLPKTIGERIIAGGVGFELNGCTESRAFAEAVLTMYDPHVNFDSKRQNPLTCSQNKRDRAVTSN